MPRSERSPWTDLGVHDDRNAHGDHSWTVERKEIDARGYDLKAVNPNAKRDEDTRTPEELLDIIEAKGREVAEALAALRALTEKKT
jgi:hypothetical protein